MDIAAATDPVAPVHADAPPERDTPDPPRLWPSLIAGWMRHLDRRIDEDMRWFDHAGATKEIRRASGG